MRRTASCVISVADVLLQDRARDCSDDLKSSRSPPGSLAATVSSISRACRVACRRACCLYSATSCAMLLLLVGRGDRAERSVGHRFVAAHAVVPDRRGRRPAACNSRAAETDRSCGRGSGQQLTVRPRNVWPVVADDVVQAVVIGQQRIGRLVVPQAEAVIAGGDDAIGRHLVQLVAGQLLADELVVRLVGVERANDVVAIPPDERLGIVALEAVRLGIAHQVEPVPAPVLAVMPRGEQPIDDLFVSVGRVVGQERRNFARGSAAGRSRRNRARRSSVALSAGGAGAGSSLRAWPGRTHRWALLTQA